MQIFSKESTYVEIQNAGLEPQARINPLLARLAEGTNARAPESREGARAGSLPWTIAAAALTGRR